MKGYREIGERLSVRHETLHTQHSTLRGEGKCAGTLVVRSTKPMAEVGRTALTACCYSGRDTRATGESAVAKAMARQGEP